MGYYLRVVIDGVQRMEASPEMGMPKSLAIKHIQNVLEVLEVRKL